MKRYDRIFVNPSNKDREFSNKVKSYANAHSRKCKYIIDLFGYFKHFVFKMFRIYEFDYRRWLLMEYVSGFTANDLLQIHLSDIQVFENSL